MHWLPQQDLDDERVLIGFTAGVLWLVGAVGGAVAQVLPGSPSVDPWVFAALDGALVVYGVASVVGWIDWTRVSVGGHAMATAVAAPVLVLALWATGGQQSYVQPILVLALVHIAYFFRPRIAVPLVAGVVLANASPLLYESDLQPGYPAQLLGFAVAGAVLTVVLRLLKRRLVSAEAHQRRIALLDPLTGLVNRRGFDEALRAAVAARGTPEGSRRRDDPGAGFALVVFDLDHFKRVNDTRGHPAGDRLLRAVAAGCAARVRPGDTLARIGGDEFALIAPGAGGEGAERLAGAMKEAVRAAGIAATLAWATAPEDGEDGEALLRTADRRLYEGKARVVAR